MTQIDLPKLYLNENVPTSLVKLLANLGIESIHTLHVNTPGRDDEFQLKYAAEKGYISVTHNRRHFRSLHKQWCNENKSHPGILVMSPGNPEYLAKRIKLFFARDYSSVTPPFCVSPPA